MNDISENLFKVNTSIAQKANGRDVTLVAVSKYHGAENIKHAIDAGQRVFGENRVQETLAKWPQLKQEHADITLHLIGPLQTNKVKEALGLFDVIETVDRQKLVNTLLKEMDKTGHRPDCYIQVNVGAEEQKSGVTKEKADGFIAAAIDAGLPVKGVMCIPPAGEDPTAHFTYLKALADRHGLEVVSMGMSGDFQQAIACGATHVRVGTAIFGQRE